MLCKLTGISQQNVFQQKHREWVASMLVARSHARDAGWSSSIAVGSEQYIDKVRTALGVKAKHRVSVGDGDKYLLREPELAYRAGFDAEMGALSTFGAVIMSENFLIQMLALVRPVLIHAY